LLTHEVFLTALGIFIIVLLTATYYHAPLEHVANPQQTPLDVKAPWYFWWLQGMLKLGDKTVMGIFIPTILVGLLLAIPYIDRNPYRSLYKRPLAVGIGIVAVITLVALSYMGTPAYGYGCPKLEEVFAQYSDWVKSAIDEGRLPQAQAVIVIEDWQANLKKVTPRIVWTDPDTGVTKTYERHIFIHKDRIGE
jgi:hypothetical protein